MYSVTLGTPHPDSQGDSLPGTLDAAGASLVTVILTGPWEPTASSLDNPSIPVTLLKDISLEMRLLPADVPFAVLSSIGDHARYANEERGMGLMTSEIQAGQAESVTGRVNTKLSFKSEPSSCFLCIFCPLYFSVYKESLQ